MFSESMLTPRSNISLEKILIVNYVEEQLSTKRKRLSYCLFEINTDSDNDEQEPAGEELADVNKTIPTLEHVSPSTDVLRLY